MLPLHFLGHGSAFNPLLNNTCAYFEFDNTLCLLDCGETAFKEIYRLELLKNKKALIVIITHLHADHVGSLGTLAAYAAYVLKIPAYIIHPENTIVDLLNVVGVKPECYQYSAHIPNQFKSALSVKPIPVTHVNNLHCFGYLIQQNNCTFYYSGDSITIPEEVLLLLKEGKLDFVFQDTYSKISENPTHCSLEELERIIPKELRNKIYCMHLDADFTDRIKKSGFNIAG